MKVGIVGCGGRMGKMLIRAVLAEDAVVLAGGTEQPGHPAVGQDLGDLVGDAAIGLSVGVDPSALFQASDCVVDFTVPEALTGHLHAATEHRVALVVGTTGLTAAHQKALEEAARSIAIVQAANMSVGVNLLLGLTQQVAAVLGEDYDIEVVEMHHRHKVDAPSGTALALGRAAADGRGRDLADVSQMVREGRVGARPPGEIGFATLRGGDVAGEHSVIFAGDGERIELTHRATDRGVFARGAVRAVLWTEGRAPGLYSMRQVLGLA